MNKFTYEGKYCRYDDCEFLLGHYSNGNLGIEIWSVDNGPITKVTVNPDIKIPEDRIAIKNYSENEGMVDWLISMSIIEDSPANVIHSGWIDIPVHRLTTHGKKVLGL